MSTEVERTQIPDRHKLEKLEPKKVKMYLTDYDKLQNKIYSKSKKFRKLLKKAKVQTLGYPTPTILELATLYNTLNEIFFP